VEQEPSEVALRTPTFAGGERNRIRINLLSRTILLLLRPTNTFPTTSRSLSSSQPRTTLLFSLLRILIPNKVMPLGLCNAPASFQSFMNNDASSRRLIPPFALLQTLFIQSQATAVRTQETPLAPNGLAYPVNISSSPHLSVFTSSSLPTSSSNATSSYIATSSSNATFPSNLTSSSSSSNPTFN
jgi:hypothetical protein